MTTRSIWAALSTAELPSFFIIGDGELPTELPTVSIYTTKGTSSPILRRSEEEWVKLCNMKK